MFRIGSSPLPPDTQPVAAERATSRALETPNWVEVTEGVSEAWDAVAAADRDATFFHTRHWAEIMVSEIPGKSIVTRVFRTGDGVQVVIPAMRSTRVGGLLQVIESMPPGVYGGPITDGSIDSSTLGSFCSLLRSKSVSSVLVTGNPFANWKLPPEFETSQHTTQVVALSSRLEAIQAGFASRCRRAIQKAERAGLTVRVATSAEDYRAYYAAYLDSLERWGDRATSHYSERVFEAIRKLDTKHARLWLAEREGEILGGIVMFYHNRHAVYWHGSYSRKAFDFGTSNFVLWEAMKDAKERGFEVFDFNPSGGHDGVSHFKESFGPTTLRFSSGIARSPLLRLARLHRTRRGRLV